jgi:hypothetical protein
LILNGNPSADATVIVHEVIHVKAKDQAEAVKRLKTEGYRNATVALETWKFPDPHTKDLHTAAVWVLRPAPGQAQGNGPPHGAKDKDRDTCREVANTEKLGCVLIKSAFGVGASDVCFFPNSGSKPDIAGRQFLISAADRS